MIPDPAALPVEVPGTTVRYYIDEHLVPRLRAVLTHPAVTLVRRPLTTKDTTVKIAKTTLTLTLAAAMALGMSACSFEEPTAPTAVETATPHQRNEPAPKPEPAVEEPAAPEYTVSQDQALISADGYLFMGGFSRSGLIEQLEYEGFSTDDATFAVDLIAPDWNEQAALSAQGYMDMGGFSAQSLWWADEDVTDFVPDEPRPLPTLDEMAEALEFAGDDTMHRREHAQAMLQFLRGESR